MDGKVDWTAPYMSWIHFGNEVSMIDTYSGCDTQSDAQLIQATVPETYNWIIEDDKIFNVFIEQWTTGGAMGPKAIEPVKFSQNTTTSQIVINY